MKSPLGDKPPLSVQRQYQEPAPRQIRESLVPIPATVLDTAVTTVITAQAGEFLRIDHVAVHCVSGTPNVRIFLVPDGGSASQTTNAVIDTSFTLDETKHLQSVEGYVLGPGMAMAALCTVDDAAVLFTSLTRITSGQ